MSYSQATQTHTHCRRTVSSAMEEDEEAGARRGNRNVLVRHIAAAPQADVAAGRVLCGRALAALRGRALHLNHCDGIAIEYDFIGM